jgi:hypothetical protein
MISGFLVLRTRICHDFQRVIGSQDTRLWNTQRVKLSISVEYFPGSGVRPWRWTESSYRFDPLLGVLILELHGAEIAGC